MLQFYAFADIPEFSAVQTFSPIKYPDYCEQISNN